MKKIVLNLVILISLQSCSQNKNQIMQNPNITADNIVENILKQIKHYPKEPIYGMHHEVEKCYFEISVNDMPAFRNFDFNVPDAFEINNTVYRKGKYTVKYKLYPVGKNENYLETYNHLVDDTQLKLSLYSYDKNNKGVDDVEHIKYGAPQIETKVTPDYSTYKFEGSGKTSYEGSFDINVDVPYDLTPTFEKAQDLSKIDKKELEAKVLKEYQKIRQIYLNKEKDNIAKLVFDRLKDDLIADYATANKVKAAWNQLDEIIIKGDVDILPIEKYKMQFFANGKLVALIKDGSDSETRGGNALVCKVKSGEFKGSIFEIKHFLYIPQGETEFKVY